MTFSIKLPASAAFKAYLVDLLERSASTFVETAAAALLMAQASSWPLIETAGIATLFAILKGILAYFVPAIGNLKTAGLLSWIISAIVKSPKTSAVVTVVPPTNVVTDQQTNVTKVSGADTP